MKFFWQFLIMKIFNKVSAHLRCNAPPTSPQHKAPHQIKGEVSIFVSFLSCHKDGSSLFSFPSFSLSLSLSVSVSLSSLSFPPFFFYSLSLFCSFILKSTNDDSPKTIYLSETQFWNAEQAYNFTWKFTQTLAGLELVRCSTRGWGTWQQSKFAVITNTTRIESVQPFGLWPQNSGKHLMWQAHLCTCLCSC